MPNPLLGDDTEDDTLSVLLELICSAECLAKRAKHQEFCRVTAGLSKDSLFEVMIHFRCPHYGDGRGTLPARKNSTA
ncbi:hypothetical protein D3C86_2014880 [compost metagenome]